MSYYITKFQVYNFCHTNKAMQIWAIKTRVRQIQLILVNLNSVLVKVSGHTVLNCSSMVLNYSTSRVTVWDSWTILMKIS